MDGWGCVCVCVVCVQVKHLAVKLNAAQKEFSTPKELLRMTVQVGTHTHILDRQHHTCVSLSFCVCVRQPPPMDALDAALTTLDELGALTNNHRNEDAGITPLGALMMTLPLDIHLCRSAVSQPPWQAWLPKRCM